MKTVVKKIRKGEFFTKKDLENPKDPQVWIRGDYDHSEKKYECINFDDINRRIYMKGDKEVYTGFTF